MLQRQSRSSALFERATGCVEEWLCYFISRMYLYVLYRSLYIEDVYLIFPASH